MDDLSMKCGLNLLEVSKNLANRFISPTDTNLEIGTVGKKFYMLNFTTGKIERLTYGAYKHCRDTWSTRRFFRDLQTCAVC